MKGAWALWRKGAYNPRNEASIVGDILVVHADLDTMPEEDLNKVLSQFIGEVRKEDGGRYPGKTLYEIISSLQKYFELKGRKVNFFSDGMYEKLTKSLDVEMKISAQHNLGLKPKQADVISVTIENSLWESNILGCGNPDTLLRTTFYLIGLNFDMRARDEHRKLSVGSFSFHTDAEGREYLLYSEGVSKTNQGGLKHRKLCPRNCKAYANVECEERCVVRIIKTYIERCPRGGVRKNLWLTHFI